MALATRPDKRPSTTRTVWGSTIGKKTIMAVSGLLMLGYLIVHMLGNLKIFFGADDFNGYARWLRTLGEPALHFGWLLWIIRVVLVVAVVLHAVCAYQLSRRDLAARPQQYVHKRRGSGYATNTMRYGGIILALFIVWHILDLTTGTVHSGGFQEGHPYQNVVDTFSTWWGNVIYIVAMLALGLHIQHGLWGAAQTLGVGSRARDRALKVLATFLSVAVAGGFIVIPVAVMTGAVS